MSFATQILVTVTYAIPTREVVKELALLGDSGGEKTLFDTALEWVTTGEVIPENTDIRFSIW